MAGTEEPLNALQRQIGALDKSLTKQWLKCRTCGSEWAVIYDPKYCPDCIPKRRPEPEVPARAPVVETDRDRKDIWKDEEPTQ